MFENGAAAENAKSQFFGWPPYLKLPLGLIKSWRGGLKGVAPNTNFF